VYRDESNIDFEQNILTIDLDNYEFVRFRRDFVVTVIAGLPNIGSDLFKCRRRLS